MSLVDALVAGFWVAFVVLRFASRLLPRIAVLLYLPESDVQLETQKDVLRIRRRRRTRTRSRRDVVVYNRIGSG
jgi:hypothetical protein